MFNSFSAFFKHYKISSLLTLIISVNLTSFANAEEITLFGGKAYASNLSGLEAQNITVESSGIAGFAYAWNNGPRGQGQIIISRTSHDFIGNNNLLTSFDVTHAHFNGVAHFRQRHYLTTVSLGLGGSQFKVEDYGDDIRPSITAALGTRYQLSEQLSIVTELRAYMVFVDNESAVFCSSNDNCLANFDDTFWNNTSLTLGLAYRF